VLKNSHHFARIIVVVGLFIALLGIGSLQTTRMVDAAIMPPSFDETIDAAKEAEFKRAAENQFCNSIPYPDLRRECQDLSPDVTRYCKTEPLKCSRLQRELDNAKRNLNQKRIDEIRTESLHREQSARNCVAARAKGMAIFNRAKLKVTAERENFETGLKNAEGVLRTTRDKIKIKRLEAVIAYFKRMIEYADQILAHFEEEHQGHVDAVDAYKVTTEDCQKFNRQFK
jgi:hypothetical protein